MAEQSYAFVSTLLEILDTWRVGISRDGAVIMFQPFLRFWISLNKQAAEMEVEYVSTLLEILVPF